MIYFCQNAYFMKKDKNWRQKRDTKRGLQNFENSVKRKNKIYIALQSQYIEVNNNHNKSANKKINIRISEQLEYLNQKYPRVRLESIDVKNKKVTTLLVPKVFSLVDNIEESLIFLSKLFTTLSVLKNNIIILDYKDCNRIDVDASMIMDIILTEFITLYRKCNYYGIECPDRILPRNIDKPSIEKVLFSIGAYKTIKNISYSFPDIIPLPPLIHNKHEKKANRYTEISELHTTEIVEYIKKCLNRVNRTLADDAERQLYLVIGEVMNNAETHGTLSNRYAIGHFHEQKEEEDHYGIFNFSIINFGETIYERFKNNCPNKDVVEKMKGLSNEYTKKRLFIPKKFEEESLWTLYALQDAVTRLDSVRGTGTMLYLKNFLELKGTTQKDESKLVIISGNTRIIFDGTYPIFEKENRFGEKFKMISFNKSNDIRELPDDKFVIFAENYFPGTIISARILIKETDLLK